MAEDLPLLDAAETLPPRSDATLTDAPPATVAPEEKFSTLAPPITLAPRRFERREPAPHSVVVWLRWAPAWVGLILFVGCLLTLLDAGPWWPGWVWQLPTWRRANGSLVVIDPGHGGWDTGAVAQGVREKDLNLDVGKRVARVLAGRGVTVRLTREDDRFITLERRVQIANGPPGAVFVSIHFNDAPTAGVPVANRASGIETFYSDTRETGRPRGWVWAAVLGGGTETGKPAFDEIQQRKAAQESQSLADSIQGSLIASTSAADRGIKERSLYVTRRVLGPSVLVEGGFVSNPAEARRLGDAAYRQQLAESIAGGIVKYLDAASRSPILPSPMAFPVRRM